jgi:thiamine biosynthesis lipoprotein
LTDRPSRGAPPPIVIASREAVEGRADNRVLIPLDAPPPAPPPDDRIRDLGGETMGTTWSARVIAPAGVSDAALLAGVQAELDRVVALYSPWTPDSEISRFNAAAPGPVVLSDDFWALLDLALELADDTNGAVDPTLGALVDLWGFGPPGPRDPSAPVPTDEEQAAALAVSGWMKLRLDRANGVAVQPGGMKLDFSAIAKGHAVDRISARLTSLGATSHLIEVGGELLGRGVKPDAQPWWVELEQPPGADGVRTVAAAYDLAVATSGDYRRYFGHNGRLFSHSIDGREGAPIRNGLASVTVLHPEAARADALATALTVMGLDEGFAHARDTGVAARFMRHDRGMFAEVLSPALLAMTDEG